MPLCKKVFSIVKKTEEAGLKPPREAARSINSPRICFEIWEREAAPAELLPDMTAIYGIHLSEPAAKFVADKLRPNAQVT